MTTTMVKDSIVGDDWIRQTMQNVPIQKIIDPATGNWNGDFLTGPVRLAFDSLFELPAAKPNQQNPKFGAMILFPPGVDFALLYEEYYKHCGQTFPECYVPPQPGYAGGYPGLHSPFRDQAEKIKFGGFTPGCTFMTVTSKYKPPVVDTRYNPIVDRSKVYPGVWAICAINAYPYGKNPPQPKKGVAFGLQSVMIIGDDTKFGGGGPDATKQFAGVQGRIAAPIVRPGVAANMPVGAPGAPAPAAGIPGYTVAGGMPAQPGQVAPAIPQQHFTPPVGVPGAAPDDEDLSFLNA